MSENIFESVLSNLQVSKGKKRCHLSVSSLGSWFKFSKDFSDSQLFPNAVINEMLI